MEQNKCFGHFTLLMKVFGEVEISVIYKILPTKLLSTLDLFAIGTTIKSDLPKW